MNRSVLAFEGELTARRVAAHPLEGSFPFLRCILEQVRGGARLVMDDIRDNLWNPRVLPNTYPGGAEAYGNALIEQYKLYVGMADQVSARRGTANSFFITLNTAVFALIGALITRTSHEPSWQLVFPLVGLEGECLAWYYLVRSYRQLNGAKFEVVGALEERLPSSPWWRAEWKALGEGKDRSKYWPLTHLEQWIPVLFALVYLGVFIGAIAS
jgi:hypothetical protein